MKDEGGENISLIRCGGEYRVTVDKGGNIETFRRICRLLCYGLHTSNVNSRHFPAADYETASVIRYLQLRAPQIHPDSASAPGSLVGSGPRHVEASESAATAQLAARGAASERAVA